MDLHQALKAVKASDVFKEFSKKGKHFLAHAFVMIDGDDQEWQIGYYCPDDDKMVSFVIDDPIEALPPAEVLKSAVKIHELDPKDVKISPEEAVEIAEETRKKNYPADLPIKTFYLIQHLPEGAVYNLTYLTRSFKTINIKIIAKDGKVHKHSNEPLMQFDSGK